MIRPVKQNKHSFLENEARLELDAMVETQDLSSEQEKAISPEELEGMAQKTYLNISAQKNSLVG